MNDRYKIPLFFIFLSMFLIYSVYLYVAQPVPNPIVTSSAERGKLEWQAQNCNACHQIYGLGGYLGPDLTNTYSKRGAKYIITFLETGTTVMPKFKLTEAQRTDLIAFLKEVDQSGSADPKSFKRKLNGTIEQ